MAPANGSLLRPGEEEWQGVFDRLCERFPQFPADRIVHILRENNGHAGQAAAALRDLAAPGMRPVDPDDAEHVRTLLSSPVMFSHCCKEQFRKHDVNGDGVLEWSEILHLTNDLYENFGLQPPREGSLKAFFEATDSNGDGVLSEREFKKFFECFLRYAFFDIAQQQQDQQKEQDEDEAEEEEEVAAAPPARHRPLQQDRQAAAALDVEDAHEGRSKKGRRRDASPRPPQALPIASGGGGVFRCLAGSVTYRRSPDYGDRADCNVQKGEEVQVLEQWIRTSKGWLPVLDKSGQVSFEAVPGISGDARGPDVEKKARGHKTNGSTGASRRSKTGSVAEEVEMNGKRRDSLPGTSPKQRPASRGQVEVECLEPPVSALPRSSPKAGGGTLRPEEEEP